MTETAKRRGRPRLGDWSNPRQDCPKCGAHLLTVALHPDEGPRRLWCSRIPCGYDTAASHPEQAETPTKWRDTVAESMPDCVVTHATPSPETTVREEWVVQNGLYDEPDVWEDVGGAPTEAEGLRLLAHLRKCYGADFRHRLAHRQITERIVTGEET